jgi:hypothetical protein
MVDRGSSLLIGLTSDRFLEKLGEFDVGLGLLLPFSLGSWRG